MKKNKYSLFTTIGMIVGIVIGSGIFFKSDNILVATNGSISLGVLIFCIAAIGIIFGGLSVAELASRTDKSGGIIAYAEEYCHKSIACAFGWFSSLLYFPTLIAIVSWVSGIYLCQLFGINSTLELQVIIGLAVLIILFLINIISIKLGGYVQNASTVIKIIPLIFIAITGLIYGDSSNFVMTDVTNMQSFGWIAAIAPIAFSFDGWIVSTSISNEIKNPKKNLPIALIIAPIFILVIYLAYFIGISIYVGPEKIMALGDAHVSFAANQLLGHFGSKIILIFVNISVLGTLNGLILGSIRMPHSLAERSMIPKSNIFTPVNDKLGLNIPSAILSGIIGLFWLGVHYITQKYNILTNSDVSEIAVIFSYVLYIILYIQVIKLFKKGEIKSAVKGIFNPCMAIIGSLIVLVGSISNPLLIWYLLILIIIVVSSIIFYKKNTLNK